jgi:two-component system chemotaxis response regulator CheB
MATHDTIVIGASAGGVQALLKLVRDLDPSLPAAVCVVLHIPANAPGLLPGILSRAGSLPVAHALDGEELRRGRVYVAPPNQHLLIERDRLR